MSFTDDLIKKAIPYDGIAFFTGIGRSIAAARNVKLIGGGDDVIHEIAAPAADQAGFVVVAGQLSALVALYETAGTAMRTTGIVFGAEQITLYRGRVVSFVLCGFHL